jgi:CHAT domain-containing protein
LVVLNACEGGRVRSLDFEPPADQIATFDARLAELIIGAGIQAFLGNLWKVDDGGSADFAVLLYQELAAGSGLGVRS